MRQSALYVYSDASIANLAGCSSQGGYVIFLKGENGKVSPLVWTSNKLKHVVKSPKAAETIHAVGCRVCISSQIPFD